MARHTHFNVLVSGVVMGLTIGLVCSPLASAAPVPDVAYDANNDSPLGAATTWAEENGVTQLDWDLDSNVTLVSVSDPATPGITKAYNFPGGANSGASTRNYTWSDFPPATPANDDPTTETATFEFWLNPGSSLAGANETQVIFEVGSNTQGLGFALQDNASEALLFQNLKGSNTLTASAPASDIKLNQFNHIVGVIIKTGSTNADLKLYVNSQLVDTSTAGSGMDIEWANGNNTGLARDEATGPLGSDPFDGQISVYNFYRGELTQQDVTSLYNQAIPEPASIALLGLGSLLVLPRRR